MFFRFWFNLVYVFFVYCAFLLFINFQQWFLFSSIRFHISLILLFLSGLVSLYFDTSQLSFQYPVPQFPKVSQTGMEFGMFALYTSILVDLILLLARHHFHFSISFFSTPIQLCMVITDLRVYYKIMSCYFCFRKVNILKNDEKVRIFVKESTILRFLNIFSTVKPRTCAILLHQ